MCGRFVSSSPPDEIARYFDAQQVTEKVLEPSYNVAPTNDVYTVYESDGERLLEPFHWGLIPFWAKDASVGNRMINARAEGLSGKPAYKRAFRNRRCIVPADGFYEWRKVPGQKRKQPVYIHNPDGEPYAFAGLWETWRDKKGQPDAEVVKSCTIVTGPANRSLREVHDRMPVILPQRAWDRWLSEDVHDIEVLEELLVPAPPKLTVFHPVSSEVNNPRNRGVHLLDPVEEQPRT